MADGNGSLLTLEPLIEAVRAGVESAGWTLSGLQKTTSHQFEGRWEGDSTRSAYLFFHHDDRPDHVSIDVYLDETSRGLTGNLALVVDLVDLGDFGDVSRNLSRLSRMAAAHLPADFRTPVTLRFRLDDGTDEVSSATSEVRFKLRIPRRVVDAGAREAESLARSTVAAFERILQEHDLGELALD